MPIQLLTPSINASPVKIRVQILRGSFFMVLSLCQLRLVEDFAIPFLLFHRMVHGKGLEPLGQHRDLFTLDQRGAGTDALLLAAAGVE